MGFKQFLDEYIAIESQVKQDHEILGEQEATKLTKSTIKKVYHRDYLKTKDKPYRKYDKRKRKRANKDNISRD